MAACWRWLRSHKMTVIHEEIYAMFLRSNGIRVGFGNALETSRFSTIHFVAARRAVLGADLAGDHDARIPG